MFSSSISAATESKKKLHERDNLSGRIDFKFPYFVHWVRVDNFYMISEEKLSIRGLFWRIVLVKERGSNFLGIFVDCENGGANKGWSCPASVQVRLHCHKENGNKNFVRNFDYNYHAQCLARGWDRFLEIEKILDPKNGWSDKYGAIHVSAEINVQEPQGLNYICRPDVLLVNKEEVAINKFHLALKSDYFGCFFFGADAKKNTKVELDPPASVEHFKRMLDAMEPENRPLDDECIEGVLKLANKFLLGEIEGKCRTFLAEHSRRSVIFKYRLAEFYGFDVLKERILESSKEEDFFKKEHFVENLNEFAKLNTKAREALLNSCLVTLFGHRVDK